jgi:hypothetical protein
VNGNAQSLRVLETRAAVDAENERGDELFLSSNHSRIYLESAKY